MKKIIIPVLHLSYGGIEKAVTSLANELVNNYQVEIISLYKIHNKPPYNINSKIKINYIIKDNIARRVEDYKILFFHIKMREEVYIYYYLKID